MENEAFINVIMAAVNAATETEMRENGVMRLGELIMHLERLPDLPVKFHHPKGEWPHNLYPTVFDSYRGYYDHLALGAGEEECTVTNLHDHAHRALGSAFIGWKGGDFVMTKQTPLWADEPGRARGLAIVSVEERDGTVWLNLLDTNETD